MAAVNNNGHLENILVGLDVASSKFKVKKNIDYDINLNNLEYTRDYYKFLKGEYLIVFYKDLIKAYIVITTKDPNNNIFSNWYNLIKEVGDKVYITRELLKIRQVMEKG